MPFADLHVHTTRSDGSLTAEELPAAARRAGVRVVAITDHDVLAPFAEPVVDCEGITIVGGVELRVEPAGAERIDLLGYGVERTDELADAIEEIQRNRRERGRAVVDCVEDRLGIDLDLDIGEGFGRPHVARAVSEHPDMDLGFQDTFDELIGSDGPCYVRREVPSFERGRRLLTDACRIVSLAHPLRYRDPAGALELAADLDAVEREYPYHRPVDRGPIDRAIERDGLLATGGSDAHDDRLGVAGLSRETYRSLDLPG